MVGIRLQDWPYTETVLGRFNLIIKSSIYRGDRATQSGHATPISASFYSHNEYILADMWYFHPTFKWHEN